MRFKFDDIRFKLNKFSVDVIRAVAVEPIDTEIDPLPRVYHANRHLGLTSYNQLVQFDLQAEK